MMQLKRLTIALLISGASLTNIALAATDTWLDNGDGTVTDMATGQIWQQGDKAGLIHADAIAYCQDLILAGNSNWHLPNIKELASIVDHRVDNPAIEEVTFLITNSQRDYWSSTDQPGNPDEAAMGIDFVDGWVIRFFKDFPLNVRCVRAR